jgi:hypothetical protein
MREKAEDAKAIRDAHQHDALRREARPVVDGNAGHASDEASTVNPHHHWQALAGTLRRCPHVEIKAVFAERRRRTKQRREIRILDTARAEGRRLLHA